MPGSLMNRLVKAIWEGNAQEIQSLLDAVPDLISEKDCNRTAILCQLLCGSEEVVDMLFTKISTLRDTVDEDGWTALHYAAGSGKKRAAEILLTKAPKLIDAVNKDGWTALRLAANWGHLDIADMLLYKTSFENVLNSFISQKRGGYIEKAAHLMAEYCKPLLSSLPRENVKIVYGYIVDPETIKPELLLPIQQGVSILSSLSGGLLSNPLLSNEDKGTKTLINIKDGEKCQNPYLNSKGGARAHHEHPEDALLPDDSNDSPISGNVPAQIEIIGDVNIHYAS